MRDHGEVEAVCSDNGGEFTGDNFVQVCNRHRVQRECTAPHAPEFNGVGERGFDMIQKVASSARAQAPVLYPDINVLTTSRRLWAEAMLWACESVNRTATTSNPNRASPLRDCGTGPLPLSKRDHSLPRDFSGNHVARVRMILVHFRGVKCFYLGQAPKRPRDTFRILTPGNGFAISRDVTWGPHSIPPASDGMSSNERENDAGCEMKADESDDSDSDSTDDSEDGHDAPAHGPSRDDGSDVTGASNERSGDNNPDTHSGDDFANDPGTDSGDNSSADSGDDSDADSGADPADSDSSAGG